MDCGVGVYCSCGRGAIVVVVATTSAFCVDGVGADVSWGLQLASNKMIPVR